MVCNEAVDVLLLTVHAALHFVVDQFYVHCIVVLQPGAYHQQSLLQMCKLSLPCSTVYDETMLSILGNYRRISVFCSYRSGMRKTCKMRWWSWLSGMLALL